MRRQVTDRGELPGQDSFLDIVANIVGILILLVMVVGLRAAQAPRQDSPKSPEQTVVAEAEPRAKPSAAAATSVSEEALANVVRKALATQADLKQQVVKAVRSKRELQLREAERVELATLIAGVEQEIEQRRQQMDQQEREDFDLRAKLGSAQQELDRLSRQRIALLSVEPAVEELESRPAADTDHATPLAELVKGESLHVRLAHGRVAVIPRDQLLDRLKDTVQDGLWRYHDGKPFSLTEGPMDGFMATLYGQMYQTQTQRGLATGVRFLGLEVKPENPQIGEPVDNAVEANSWFMSRVRQAAGRQKQTIIVWTYPESFKHYRRLKDALFDAGFSVAGRPMPAGETIGWSPNGTKSAAQ